MAIVENIASDQQENMQKPRSFVMPRTHLREDPSPVPEGLFEESTEDQGTGVLSKESVTSAEFHQREVKHLWKKVWQMACRENDIPNVGDRLPYDVVGQSVMLVRTAAGTIKAYHNTCRHRGTRLVDKCDNVRQITCPFHSWSWNLDGSLKNVPSRWDFPDVSNSELALREVRCERWNSFVFINFDKDAQPLEEFIGPTLLRHWKAWPRAGERKVYHYGKIVPSNWKLALYAFQETYHTVGIHPQSLRFAGDCNAQHDFFGPHSRFIATQGTPSAYIADTTDAQETVDAFLDCYAPDVYPDGHPKVGSYREARKVLADIVRGGMRKMTGVDLTQSSDVEVLDAISYNFFPNTIFYGGHALSVIHRFRPNGDDHRSCLWEIMALAPFPENTRLERDAELVMLGPEDLFANQPILGFIGEVLDQDVRGLTLIQKGQESDGFDGPRFAKYQERNLRNFELYLAKLVAQD
jgi:phenylpropionate dioxygenase-like ring-hydroxylating dioxygenase large terminal subunit